MPEMVAMRMNLDSAGTERNSDYVKRYCPRAASCITKSRPLFGFTKRREYDGSLSNRIQESPWKTLQGLHQSLIPNQ